MTDKITIERETLERAIAALTYHQNQTRPIESTRIALDTMRASLAAQPTVDDHLKCGHHRSLAINSAETGEFLYCDLCDAKSRCRDAEAMEAELRAALAAQPAEPVGDVVVSCNEDGQIVAVTRQDDEGRILSVIAESAAPPAPAAVPPGYVLVPTEATEALLGRLMDAVWRTTHGDADITKEEARGIYRAMIAAGDKP